MITIRSGRYGLGVTDGKINVFAAGDSRGIKD
jgi:hypothetical protein